MSAVPVAVSAADAPESPKALQKILDCRVLTDDVGRLACYDTNVTQLSAAQTRGDIALVDREQIRETRRKLFGFTLPTFAIFGDERRKSVDAQDREGVEEVTANVKAATRNSEGYWTITLESGARWEQTAAMTFGRNPKPGSVATIKRSALGSFKMSFDGGPSVKAKRVG